MFGSDQYKSKDIEKILEAQNFTEASYSRSFLKWKEGKHLEKVFYAIAKEEGLTYDEVKSIYFEGWAMVSQHMRHVDLPIIEIPHLGRLVPASIILTRQIKTGHVVWDRVKDKDPAADPPFFLTALMKVKARRDVELCCHRPRYIQHKEDLTEEDLMDIGRVTGNHKAKKYLFMHYLCEIGDDRCMNVIRRLNEERGEDYNCDNRFKILKKREDYETAKEIRRKMIDEKSIRLNKEKQEKLDKKNNKKNTHDAKK